MAGQQSYDRPEVAFISEVRRRNAPLVQQILAEPRGRAADRLLGSLLGLAVGDVLGAPVEGLTPAQIRRRYGGVTELICPLDRRNWRVPGLHTDDTQQAMAVLIACRVDADGRAGCEDGKRDEFRRMASDLATIYVRGAQSGAAASLGCWRGTGSRFRASVQRLSDLSQAYGPLVTRAPEWPWGCTEPSAGLGALMKIPPLGVAETRDGVVSTARLAAAATRVTHGDPEGAAAAAVATLAARLLRDSDPATLNPHAFLATLVSQAREVERTLPELVEDSGPAVHAVQQRALTSTLVAVVPRLLPLQTARAMQTLEQANLARGGSARPPTAGSASLGLAACLYFVLRHQQDPIAAILAGINAGGDTDTIGAITGGLDGALHGPAPLRPFLPDVVGLELIVNVARGQPVDLVAEETRLSLVGTDLRRRHANAVQQRTGNGRRPDPAVRDRGRIPLAPVIAAPPWRPPPPLAANHPLPGNGGMLAAPNVSPLATPPAELVSRTRSHIFSVRHYYQINDPARHAGWKARLRQEGNHERWLFCGCPPPMVGDVLKANEPLPYGGFFPRLYGPHARYLFRHAADAARVALASGTERHGLLLSCRLNPGATFHAPTVQSVAGVARAYDTVIVPAGADLGFGTLLGEMAVTFDGARLLPRYITAIEAP